MTQLEERILLVSSEKEFEELALEVFRFQYTNVQIYREYVDRVGNSNPQSIFEIPFLPIGFFKSHQLIAEGYAPELIFKSSGTGGIRSQHFVAKEKLYERTFTNIYRKLIGAPEGQVILALLPNYLEQGESSLVFMVNHLIDQTKSPLSGFFLQNHEDLLRSYKEATGIGRQVVIFGVSYALLDLIDTNIDLSKAIIIETGGMKGRRKELTKAELHQRLKSGLNCNTIASEYGMTELLSQGYSIKDQLYIPGNTMRVFIREINDPFTYAPEGKTGGINVIDLANLYSCSFIETQDLGRLKDAGFEIMGRFDNSDIRGCNLMVQ